MIIIPHTLMLPLKSEHNENTRKMRLNEIKKMYVLTENLIHQPII